MNKIISLIAILLMSSAIANADVPKTISFQGQITDINDQPIADGEHVVQFKLYDCAAGGTALWQESQDITTENGYFAITLGANALGTDEELDTSLFGQTLWVGIKVGAGDEMMPRIQLQSTPYAMNVANNAVDTETIKNGTIKDEDMASGVSVPVGTVLAFAGESGKVPGGWLLCNGAEVSRTTYSKLYLVIEGKYGAGDGVTTFNLPNLQRRVIVGAGGVATAVLGNEVGDEGGEEKHMLTNAEMPVHDHGGYTGDTYLQSGNTGPHADGEGNYGVNIGENHSHTIPNDGGGEAHNNMQPSMVMNFIIKY